MRHDKHLGPICAAFVGVVAVFAGVASAGVPLDGNLFVTEEASGNVLMFNGAEVSTILLVFIALVWLADWVSAKLREVLA